MQIALLPDSSHLGQLPNGVIKLKTFAIGPTTHVLSQSQVASILWHPCGVAGNCLVTTTVDAVVRVWEFSRDNRWSTDSPTLAIDLKKLITGSSEEQDFAPGRTRNRAFSLDSVGLEVASACFGGSGSSDESAWSAATLWLAMRGGDVYAICPLLPSKWQPPSTLIPSISTVVVGKIALAQDESQSDQETRQYNDQYEWIRGIDSQEPMIAEGKDEFSPNIEVYSRPTTPGAIPRLQGPFQIFSEDTDEDLELSDIYVIAGKIDAEALISGDDSDSEPDWMDEQGVSAAVVCLMTRSGRVYVCLDLEGVEGQWLPRKKPKRLPEALKEPYLIVLEGLETLNSTDLLDLEWPTFTGDVQSRYSFFVTHSKGIFFFSLDPWVRNLEQELQSNESLGAPFRIDIIKNGPGTLREKMLTFSPEQDSVSDSCVAACLVLEDSDLGYFLLTSVNGTPKAAILEKLWLDSAVPVKEEEEEEEDILKTTLDTDMLSLRGPARETYQVPQIFSTGSSLPKFLGQNVLSRHQKLMKENVRMSTNTLDLMTSAHRAISKETHLLGVAAADLFRRCERLQNELRDQIRRANEVAHRTEVIVGEDADQYVGNTTGKGHAALDERLKKVRSRHQELASRHEKLRERFSKAGEEVSEKEKVWFAEVKKTADSVGVEAEEQTQKQGEAEDGQGSEPETLQRYQDVKELTIDLVARAKEAVEQGSNEQTNGEGIHVIPSDLRKERVTKVMKLLEREYVDRLPTPYLFTDP